MTEVFTQPAPDFGQDTLRDALREHWSISGRQESSPTGCDPHSIRPPLVWNTDHVDTFIARLGQAL